MLEKELLALSEMMGYVPPSSRTEIYCGLFAVVYQGDNLESWKFAELPKAKECYEAAKSIVSKYDITEIINVLYSLLLVSENGISNNVVFTPSYVANFLAELGDIGEGSVVIDCTAGGGTLLYATLKKNPRLICGVEKNEGLYEILDYIRLYTSADCQIECGDALASSLAEKCNVMLLNPPYGAKGKGLVFADHAMQQMKPGRAVILIQENAGSNAEWTEKILAKNTLLASIHMADVFKGIASVQTAVYVLQTQRPHKEEDNVIFIDMSQDGYYRTKRKGIVKLKDDGTAQKRYADVAKMVNDFINGKDVCSEFYGEMFYIACGVRSDWTYTGNKVYDTVPTEGDFMDTVERYLSWKVSQTMK